MNELKVFSYEGNKVRTVIKGGEPWWVLKDVCAVLDIADYKQVRERLDEDEVGVLNTPHPQSPAKTLEMLCVNESGLCSAILRSDKPNARPFRK